MKIADQKVFQIFFALGAAPVRAEVEAVDSKEAISKYRKDHPERDGKNGGGRGSGRLGRLGLQRRVE